MDLQILLNVASKGALQGAVEISSSQLAKDLGTSQQTAARRLKSLEDEGLISRIVVHKGQTVRITDKGRELLGGIYLDLSTAFGEGRGPYTICGIVSSGMGEGEYYMRMEDYKSQFQEKLGFEPYPGTLNLKLKGNGDLKARQELGSYPGLRINGFSAHGRTFGTVKCFRADIEGIEGAVVMPSRTHHDPDTLEVIAESKIRDMLKITDGDRICVKIRIGEYGEAE